MHPTAHISTGGPYSRTANIISGARYHLHIPNETSFQISKKMIEY